MKQKARSSSDAASPDFVWKEWAVFVPTLTTCLALAWQVGSLDPIGGFAYFSITDHLVSAAKALPLALGASTIVALTYAVFFSHRSPEEMVRIARVSAMCLGLIGYPLAGLLFYLEYQGSSAPFLFTAVELCALVAGIGLLAFRPIDRHFSLFLAFAALTLLCAAFASDLTLSRLLKVEQGRVPLASITTRGGTSKAYVLMSGERGLLLYEPDGSAIFIRSDEVQMIDYPRAKRSHSW